MKFSIYSAKSLTFMTKFAIITLLISNIQHQKVLCQQFTLEENQSNNSGSHTNNTQIPKSPDVSYLSLCPLLNATSPGNSSTTLSPATLTIHSFFAVTNYSVDCTRLPIACYEPQQLTDCTYGSNFSITLHAHPAITCQPHTRSSNRSVTCRFCHQLAARQIACLHRKHCHHKYSLANQRASPITYYPSVCVANHDAFCLGARKFRRMLRCRYSSGTRWSVAFCLSLFLGGFGADRFYLGSWGAGLGKLVSFGGLGVWSIIDLILIFTGYLKPSDGSVYV